MIGAAKNAIDNFFGRGDAAVTVPPLDGALRPNRMLDDASARYALEGVVCLACVGGQLVASAGKAVFKLSAKKRWSVLHELEDDISCVAPFGEDGLAITTLKGEIVVHGGAFDGKRYRAGVDITCVTAMAAEAGVLYLANGSDSNGPNDWQRDLMQRKASGSVWKVDLASGKSERIATNLAWPSGLAVDGGALVISEAWKHRLVRLDPGAPGQPKTLHHDLPAYPGRLSRSQKGWWLAAFAPRSQLVEFILREPDYRKRMLDVVPQDFWIAPKLQSGKSFYEPLQGGGVKHLGQLKPWAPTMSAGLCVGLDSQFQSETSLQSRADGATHGITSIIEVEEKSTPRHADMALLLRFPRHRLEGGNDTSC